MAHDPCSRIQALYPRLSKVEAKIADYILRDPLRVTELSVQAMAQEIGVAQSSIVRFCRTIECSGLRELKLQLASHENAFVIPRFLKTCRRKTMHRALPQKYSRAMSTPFSEHYRRLTLQKLRRQSRF